MIEEQSEPLARPVVLPSHTEIATKICQRLNETTSEAQGQIRRYTWALGVVQAWALLLDVLEVEESGGMMLPDGSRRRTPGGVWFFLVRNKGVPEEGKKLNLFSSANMGKKKPVPTTPPFTWDDRIAIINDIGAMKGTATTMKITLIGTLGKTVDKGSCVMGVMQSSEKVPALPKGVPAPQQARTQYTVYIGAKQWKTVAAAARDPEDALIIEGYPQVDAPTGTIAVFVSKVTSKKLQAAIRTKEVV